MDEFETQSMAAIPEDIVDLEISEQREKAELLADALDRG